MTKSPLFHTKAYQQVEADIKKFLNSQPDFLAGQAFGEVLQGLRSSRHG